MAIINLTRDYGTTNPNIVRLESTDNLATVFGSGYLTAQLANTTALNSGPFEWFSTDLVAVAASDGQGLGEFDGDDFTTIIDLLAGGAVASLTGTAYQVLVNGTSGSAQTGVITLTTPQNIDTTSSPTFSAITLTTGATNNYVLTSNSSGLASWAAPPSGSVPSVQGTANEVLVNGTSGSAQTGAITLTTPQEIAITSTPAFAGLNLNGASSGTVSILPQAAAGTYNFNLPTTAGTSGYVLTSAGGSSSAMTWTDPTTFGGLTPITISGTTQLAAINSFYVIGNSAQTTVTLPVAAAVGSTVVIAGFGDGGFVLAPGSGQEIIVGNVSGTTSVTSNARYDSITVVCTIANKKWLATAIVSAGFVIL